VSIYVGYAFGLIAETFRRFASAFRAEGWKALEGLGKRATRDWAPCSSLPSGQR